MSGTEERKYLCPNCETLLLISALPEGIVRGVLCSRCRKRCTIQLGRPPADQLVSRNADCSPRPANAPPPIESRTATGQRSRG